MPTEPCRPRWTRRPGGQIGTAEYRSRRQPGLIRDRPGGDRPVAGDHHHPHSGALGGGDRLGNIRTQRIRQSEEAHRLKQEVMGIGRGSAAGLAAAMAGVPRHGGGALQAPGHRQHPQPLSGQLIGSLLEAPGRLRRQVAEVGDGLRSPLGRQTALPPGIAPQARHHQQVRLEGVLPL